MATEEVREPVTIGKVRYLQTLDLDPQMIEELNVESQKYLLVVFHTTNKTIRVYPCDSNFAYKLIIIMDKVLPDFIGRLGSILMRLKIQPIFTSALCFYEDVCTYEAYFDPSIMENKIDPLTRDILEITGIKEVRIKTIT